MYPVENSAFSIVIEDILTDLDRRVLTYLYLPIIGEKALSIYQTLFTMVNPLEKESSILSHSQVLNLLKLSAKTFTQERRTLEAVGLLSTYYKDGLFVYVLKNVLKPYEFFSNKELCFVLESFIGKEEIERLTFEFLVRRIDVSSFEDITIKFNDVFEPVDKDYVNNNYLVGVESRNNGILIDNTFFNMEHFILLIEAMDIVSKEALSDSKFLDLINRYAFLYKLSVEQLKDAVVLSVNVDKTINFDELNMHVRRIFDNRNNGVTFATKREVVQSSNKLINALNKMSPNDIVKNKYKVELTSAEIDMFDRLLKDTNVSVGILNVAVLYVVSEKNGEIPAYNYFLKIINTWKRAGIKTTEEALNHINGVTTNKTKVSSGKAKTIKAKPDWYKNEEQGSKEPKTPEVELQSDILDFFKPKK